MHLPSDAGFGGAPIPYSAVMSMRAACQQSPQKPESSETDCDLWLQDFTLEAKYGTCRLSCQYAVLAPVITRSSLHLALSMRQWMLLLKETEAISSKHLQEYAGKQTEEEHRL